MAADDRRVIDQSTTRLSAWYDLFSRGARDWLRHNEKVRDAVRAHLPQIVAGADVLTRGTSHGARARARCSSTIASGCARPTRRAASARARRKPGDRIGSPADPASASGSGGGGDDDGGIQYMLEFQVDDIVDWLWEEMQLPNLENARRRRARRRAGRAKAGTARRALAARSAPLAEGIGQAPGRAARTRPTFTDDDLRFRQLARREQPATQAVVFLVLDVSGSMGEAQPQARQDVLLLGRAGPAAAVPPARDRVRRAHDRGLGVRRGGILPGHRLGRHVHVGGARPRCARSSTQRYSPAQYNIYLFYASDGENSPSDAAATQSGLDEAARRPAATPASSRSARRAAADARRATSASCS